MINFEYEVETIKRSITAMGWYDKAANLTKYIRVYKELKKENAELKAHVERLRDAYKHWGDEGVTDGELLKRYELAILATPAQSLAEIEAAAIENSLADGLASLVTKELNRNEFTVAFDRLHTALQIAANQLADKIRKKAKETK